MMAKVLDNENEGPGVVIPAGVTKQAEAVAHAIEAALPAADPAPEPENSGGDARKPKRRSAELPDDAAVKPIGIKGTIHWYLDHVNQLQGVLAKDHGRLVLESMFGPNGRAYLEKHWPRKDKSGEHVVGYRAEDIASALMSASAKRGLWCPEDRCRGPGAWRGADGELVDHCGTQLWKSDKPEKTK